MNRPPPVMRFDGTLRKWNAERGFGFIAADQGGQELFVHISAFPRDGRQPAEGEALSFEVEPDRNGKKQAVRVLRQGQVLPPAAPTDRHAARARRSARRESRLGAVLVIVGLLAAVGWFGYGQFSHRLLADRLITQRTPAGATPNALTTSAFKCDGRTYCSQMTSCKEAKFFLQNCPNAKMDGNHDGVPCEQQWCTDPFAD